MEKDLKIWEKIRNGDALAMKVLHDKYYYQLYLYAQKISNHPSILDEAVSDCFIKLWTRRNELLIERSVKSYLFLMLRNGMIDMLRSKKHSLYFEDEAIPDIPADDNIEIYLNGKELVNSGFTTGNNTVLKIDNSLLKRGKKNLLAAHCQNPMGGGLVDFGLIQRREKFQQTAVQKNLSLSATQTHYAFTCGPIDLNLQFVSPLLPDDLDLMSRPVNYINYEVVSNDAKKHDVQIYFEITPEWAVNVINQEVEVTNGEINGIKFVKAGTTKQPILQKYGDNIRIDWGYVYLAANKGTKSTVAIGDYFETKESFIQNGQLPKGPDKIKASMTRQMPAMAYVDKLGSVSGKATSKGYLMLAYDDIKSIQYFGDNLKAWWTKPFPSHDVGSYPLANGQTYGGDMPVGEGGNMLILTTAIAGYGRLAEMLGRKEIAEKYTSEARRMAKEWMRMADDGDHYRLTFDQPGTWSQKYNLVWDQVLKLGIFPKEVAQKEVAYYLTKQNKYGIPLDSRKDYTKSDWIVWSAAMADNLGSFQKLTDPLHLYITETPNRVPMSDWYGTKDAVKLNFQARSVVGAYFIKLLK